VINSGITVRTGEEEYMGVICSDITPFRPSLRIRKSEKKVLPVYSHVVAVPCPCGK
jgi:hypothetical protein